MKIENEWQLVMTRWYTPYGHHADVRAGCVPEISTSWAALKWRTQCVCAYFMNRPSAYNIESFERYCPHNIAHMHGQKTKHLSTSFRQLQYVSVHNGIYIQWHTCIHTIFMYMVRLSYVCSVCLRQGGRGLGSKKTFSLKNSYFWGHCTAIYTRANQVLHHVPARNCSRIPFHQCLAVCYSLPKTAQACTSRVLLPQTKSWVRPVPAQRMIILNKLSRTWT